jgi:hypothetical protein
VIRNMFSPYLVVPLKTALILSRLRPRYQSERIFIQSKGSLGGQEVEIAHGPGADLSSVVVDSWCQNHTWASPPIHLTCITSK